MQEKGLQILENLGNLCTETLPTKYPNLPQLIARRTTPGILIFTANQELVYINAEARRDLISLGVNRDTSLPDQAVPLSIPETVTNLCHQLKLMVSSTKVEAFDPQQSQTPSVLALSTTGSEAYSFRAFYLSNYQRGTDGRDYILVLIERVSPAEKINLNKAAQRYKLSKREVEVVELLILGHKNKEIAERLCLCIYTIEDHLKKIMKKMQVGNRTSILAKLLETL
ncbi:MAG: helix-turn-helix transcriptional regulator [Thermodesulfobacteriota bacterium]